MIFFTRLSVPCIAVNCMSTNISLSVPEDYQSSARRRMVGYKSF